MATHGHGKKCTLRSTRMCSQELLHANGASADYYRILKNALEGEQKQNPHRIKRGSQHSVNYRPRFDAGEGLTSSSADSRRARFPPVSGKGKMRCVHVYMCGDEEGRVMLLSHLTANMSTSAKHPTKCAGKVDVCLKRAFSRCLGRLDVVCVSNSRPTSRITHRSL